MAEIRYVPDIGVAMIKRASLLVGDTIMQEIVFCSRCKHRNHFDGWPLVAPHCFECGLRLDEKTQNKFDSLK
jgi:uncharacterized protein (DUF983 family)